MVGAKKGDVLVVDILDVGPLPSSMWGFTGILIAIMEEDSLPTSSPEPRKAIWDFHGIYATSRHIEGVLLCCRVVCCRVVCCCVVRCGALRVCVVVSCVALR